ncbi:SMI1/KNR4 family protein [Roseovarius atlanticus]|uniref:SMI1/KNR4 family protein n=1 Tax=Roseovarius atlanticus TaxID=1641875 RepID=UPI00070B2CFD|nr:SMI1/KNR4 family protein [Roseovarius atlanticus]
MAQCRETPASLSPDALDLLQRVLGASLPPAYRTHLATRNGWMPEKTVFAFAGKTGTRRSNLHVLYAVNAAEDWADLWAVNRTFAEDTGPWHLCIGADDGGNQLVLALKGPEHGKVFFWAVDLPFAEGLRVVAPDFGAFLSGLTGPDPLPGRADAAR